MEKDEILIVKMYSGSYLKDDDNIGHEAINLYTDDNGNSYIYVCPYGWISKKHNDKINTIFLAQNAGDNELELLAVVPNPEQILKITYSMPKFVKNPKKQINIQKNNENHNRYLICKKQEADKPEMKEIIKNTEYGGVNIAKIFKKNRNNDEDTFSHVTFKAEKVLKVNEEYKNKLNELGIKLKRDRLFISKNNDVNTYNDLVNLADELKEKCTNKTCKYNEELEQNNKNLKANLLKIIRKENDELVVSNLLKYVFCKLPNLFANYANKFDYKRKFSTNFNIVREKEKNIDLLIIDKDHKNILLIENKIKSDIHGKTDNNGKWISQLTKYKEYVEEKYKDFDKKYIVLSPNYNRFVRNRKKEIEKEGYILVLYSEIKEFFESKINECTDVDYFEEFLKILDKHSKKYDITFKEEMFEKFKNMIENAEKEVI